MTTKSRTRSGTAASSSTSRTSSGSASTTSRQKVKDRSTKRSPTSTALPTVGLLARAKPQIPYVVRW